MWFEGTVASRVMLLSRIPDWLMMAGSKQDESSTSVKVRTFRWLAALFASAFKPRF